MGKPASRSGRRDDRSWRQRYVGRVSAPASVDVIVVDLAAAPPGIDRLLGADERAAAQRMPASRARSRRIAARATLRLLLAGRLGLEPSQLRFEAGSHGKPRLCGGELAFNVSHSGDLALYAIAERLEVGVDVELASRRLGRPRHELAIARRVLDPEVHSRLAALSGEERSTAFLQAWVEHEARVKCAGLGTGVASDGSVGSLRDRIWVRALHIGEGILAALAVQGGPAAVSVHRLRAGETAQPPWGRLGGLGGAELPASASSRSGTAARPLSRQGAARLHRGRRRSA